MEFGSACGDWLGLLLRLLLMLMVDGQLHMLVLMLVCKLLLL